MEFEITTIVAIDIDCVGSCKSNYHTVMTMMPPKAFGTIYIYMSIVNNISKFWLKHGMFSQ